MTRSLIRLGPIAVDAVSAGQALDRIEQLLTSGSGGYVVTPNVDHIVLAAMRPSLAAAYRESALSLADGQPLVWMARWLGTPLPEKISGSDFVFPLMQRAAQRGWRVFLFGGSPQSSAEAAWNLTSHFPGLRIVGRDTSRWDGGDDDQVVARIRNSGAHIVIVALGCPKQEAWMRRHAHRIAPAVALGLGGTLDFVAGAVPRAPAWMSRRGLEWVHRLAQDPRRLAHRYLVRDASILPLFGGMVTARVRQFGQFLRLRPEGFTVSIRHILRSIRPGMRRPARRVLLVGAGPLARAAADDLRHAGDVRIMGAVPLPGEPTSGLPGLPAPAPLAGLARWLERHWVDEVYLAADVATQRDPLQSVVAVCERLGVPFAVPAHGFRMQRALPSDPRVIADGFLHYTQQAALRPSRHLKRAIDIAGAAAGLLLTAPLLALAAIAVRLESGGPVLFHQERVGRHGRTFRLLKLRSMVADAESRRAELEHLNEHREGPVFKIAADPRVTRVGRWLRRTSVDELPQLWNVLRGEMSLVGPRPPLPSEVVQYDAWQRRRLSVTPGLTGIWQVSGRDGVSFDQWMRMDLQYIDNWSLGLDLSLIGRTIPAVFSGRGAS